MKKFGCYFVVIFILSFSGCAGLEVKREVDNNNIFHSSSQPELNVKVSPDLKYFGEYKETRNQNNQQYGLYSTTNKIYAFAEVGENNVISRGVLISYFTLNDRGWTWNPGFFKHIQSPLDLRATTIQGLSYEKVVGASRFFLPNEREFIYKQGYLVSDCYLFTGIARIVSKDSAVKMYIFYIEDMEYDKQRKKFSCQDWTDKSMLLEEQKELLNKFFERSESAYQILGDSQQTPAPLMRTDNSPTENDSDIVIKLGKLRELFKKGLITEEEYNNKKAELLREL